VLDDDADWQGGPEATGNAAGEQGQGSGIAMVVQEKKFRTELRST
jgi:hypothetical protein